MEEFISYGKQSIDKDDIDCVISALKSDFLTQGPKVNEFEAELCRITGAKYALAVSNGTAALHLAVLALQIEKNSEAITTPNTFVASANAALYAGLKVKFADIDSNTFNISPQGILKKITAKTKLIIAVDFAGRAAQMKEIKKIAKEKNIYVIEDAAHALGSKYASGEMVGSCKYSDLTTFSFHPVKTITTAEGGAITTNNKDLHERLLLLRSHGITKDEKRLKKNPGPWYYEMQELGFNYRLSDIQAALGLSQLKKLDRFSARRREIVDIYNSELKDLENVVIPFEEKGLDSTFHLYVLQIDFKSINKTRTQVMEELRKLGIGTQVHYIPVHLQPYYIENLKTKVGDFKNAEEYYKKALSIPLYPKMNAKDVKRVVSSIKKVLKSS